MLKHVFQNFLFICFLLISSSQLSANEATAEALVDAATNAVNTFTIDPDMKWFRDNMRNAKGVLIVPQLVKGGFIFGGSGGSGVLLVKGDGNIWSDPAFYTMGSGTRRFSNWCRGIRNHFNGDDRIKESMHCLHPLSN